LTWGCGGAYHFERCSVFDACGIFVLGERLTVVSAVDSIGGLSGDWCAVGLVSTVDLVVATALMDG
jgi:hypothetical protein